MNLGCVILLGMDRWNGSFDLGIERGVLSMHIVVIGLNDKTAPVALRERCTFLPHQLDEALATLKGLPSVVEAVLLATCNRTELYLLTDRSKTKSAIELSLQWMSRWFGLPQEAFQDHLYIYEDVEAMRHLFRVAAGLDSMIIGETQILGQVKEAWELARHHKMSAKILNQLFKQAITFAKRMHHDYGLNDAPVSVAYAASVLAKKMFEDLKGKHVLILGAGATGTLIAQHFHALGASLTIANRTIDRARMLAKTVGGRYRTLEDIPELLEEADIVVGTTASPKPLVTEAMIRQHLSRRSRPLVFLDLALPRDIEPVAMSEVYAYDLDDLKKIVDEHLAARQKLSQVIETHIDEEIRQFQAWLETLHVIPVMAALQERGKVLQERSMRSLENKLPDLDERSRRLIEKYMKNLVNQLLQDPIIKLKETAGTKDGEMLLRATEMLFNLVDDQPDEHEEKSKASETSDHRQRPSEEAVKKAVERVRDYAGVVSFI